MCAYNLSIEEDGAGGPQVLGQHKVQTQTVCETKLKSTQDNRYQDSQDRQAVKQISMPNKLTSNSVSQVKNNGQEFHGNNKEKHLFKGRKLVFHQSLNK